MSKDVIFVKVKSHAEIRGNEVDRLSKWQFILVYQHIHPLPDIHENEKNKS